MRRSPLPARERFPPLPRHTRRRSLPSCPARPPPRIVSRRGGRHWCFSQLPSEGAVGGSTLTAFRGVADWSRPTPPITLGEEVFASYFQSRAILVSWALIEITQRCACIYSPEGLTPQFVGVLTSELFGALFVRSCPARGARGGPIGK